MWLMDLMDKKKGVAQGGMVSRIAMCSVFDNTGGS